MAIRHRVPVDGSCGDSTGAAADLTPAAAAAAKFNQSISTKIRNISIALTLALTPSFSNLALAKHPTAAAAALFSSTALQNSHTVLCSSCCSSPVLQSAALPSRLSKFLT